MGGTLWVLAPGRLVKGLACVLCSFYKWEPRYHYGQWGNKLRSHDLL